MLDPALGVQFVYASYWHRIGPSIDKLCRGRFSDASNFLLSLLDFGFVSLIVLFWLILFLIRFEEANELIWHFFASILHAIEALNKLTFHDWITTLTLSAYDSPRDVTFLLSEIVGLLVNLDLRLKRRDLRQMLVHGANSRFSKLIKFKAEKGLLNFQIRSWGFGVLGF